jgi:hypothetical protein
MLINALRNKKRFVLGPAISTFAEAHFVISEWFTVSGRSVLFVR